MNLGEIGNDAPRFFSSIQRFFFPMALYAWIDKITMQYVIWKVQRMLSIKVDIHLEYTCTVIPIRLCSILFYTMNTAKSPTIWFIQWSITSGLAPGCREGAPLRAASQRVGRWRVGGMEGAQECSWLPPGGRMWGLQVITCIGIASVTGDHVSSVGRSVSLSRKRSLSSISQQKCTQ